MWIAGCATGEEAYSLAICLHEYFSDNAPNLRIQVFASDISEHVIAKARAGIFSRVIESYLDGQSWDISQLRTNVGHLEGTSWLNQNGNIVLAAHVELSDGTRGAWQDRAAFE